MNPDEKRILRALTNYAQFNAERTLGVGTDSEFSAMNFGAATALCDPARPRLPMYNRVLGLDADDSDRLGDILAHYKVAGCEPHFDLGTDAIVPELITALIGRGFEPHDAITYLTASPGAQSAKKNSGVTIERWGNDRADEFRTLLGQSGVTCEDEIWEKRRPLYASDTFRVFIASLDSEPAAWATAFVDAQNNACYLANAFTLPDRRSRGCHRALLDARLADAHEIGLKTAITDVVPETGSHRNCKRTGFKSALTLTLWHR